MDYDEHLSFAQINEKIDIIIYQNHKILEHLGLNKNNETTETPKQNEPQKAPKPQEKQEKE